MTDAPAPANDCCPSLASLPPTDVIDPVYRLPYTVEVAAGEAVETVTVMVGLRFRLTRTPGDLGLGDVVHSTTLLPGESVKLAVSDSSSRFSYDSETQLSHYDAATSNESAYMASMAFAVSNQQMVTNSNLSQNHHEDSASGGGSLGLDLGFISIGGGGGGSSYNSSSTTAFADAVSRNAMSYSNQAEVAMRARSSVSIGMATSRTHASGESETTYEASTRVFSNPNRCRALSFLFHQVVREQTLSWELTGITRDVDDPAAPTDGPLRDAPALTGFSVVPQRLSTLNSKLLDTQGQAFQAADARFQRQPATGTAALDAAARAFAIQVRESALAIVDRELTDAGLLDLDTGQPTPAAQAKYGWQRTLTIPTPGVVVKTCLDDCQACEPEAVALYQAQVQRAQLENQLLAKQIELLSQSQEYRCCPDSTEKE